MPCRLPSCWPLNGDHAQMRMTRTPCKLAARVLLVWLYSLPALALTLGQVQMQSGLGQPLLAQIPVYDAEDADMQSLTVGLASEEAFRRLGIDRHVFDGMQVRLRVDEFGRAVVELRTERPFQEPILNVLIEASWRNGGRLVKEVTALVDPPFIDKAAVQTIEAPSVALSPVIAAPISASDSEHQADTVADADTESVLPRAQRVFNSARISAVGTPDQTRTVQGGESLYSIAAAHRQQLDSTVSLNQMMAAIQRANPDAFIGGDANLLKRGSVLRLPEAQEVKSLRPEDSSGLLAAQWTRKIKAQPVPVLDAANRLADRGSSRRQQSQPVPVQHGVLKIVPTEGHMNDAGSQSGASKFGQGKELRAESNAGQEELAARQAEIDSLRQQLDEAARLQNESKRLIDMQSSQIKQLTERMQHLEHGAPAPRSVAGTQEPSSVVADPWYFSPYTVFAALLLMAGLLGILLKRRR